MQFLGPFEIVARSLWQLLPVWLGLAAVLGAVFAFRRRLGLLGHIVETGPGLAGLLLVGFWLFAAIFARWIMLFDPLGQIAEMKDALPGAIEPSSHLPYLFGGDRLARDVFARVIAGSRVVLVIAPLATLLALSMGIALGLPAGYFGRRIDAVLSFLANLVLAFPIILLFYLLVSPGILETPIPYALAAIFFLFPIALSVLFIWTGYKARPVPLVIGLVLTALIGGWLFATFVFDADPLGILRVSPSTLNIFIAVALASGPGIFRIVRGLTLDIKTREYVLAAQTRGESPWYIMLWEILPNARGPLIVDSCLRIGYTTILLGALGYFGLGMPPESPDWGTTIKEASRFMRLYIHPALPAALAMMSFVLGLNLLADALREQSLGIEEMAPILEIDNLSISFFTRAGEIPSVMDFSCKVEPGQSMGLVGESGCGKSTVALAVMRDLPKIGRVTKGTIRFKGCDMASLSEREMREIRGSKIAMVYQEPMASLNPTMRIGRQLMEAPLIHDKVGKAEAERRAIEMVKAVRLPDPERMMRSYPHQLSGGQQQRVVIAMALLCKPELLILDEPTTALDVTVEAGIVALVKDLAERQGASMLFISHNLGLILETCDRVTVMYSGEAVETGAIEQVFGSVRHPYTRGLFLSMPMPGTNKNSNPLVPIPGQLPLPHHRPRGCHFGPRCPHFLDGVCNDARVPMLPIFGDDEHFSRCLRIDAIDWSRPDRAAEQSAPIAIGEPVLDVSHLKKHYQVAASQIFGGREARTVKAVEDISFVANEAETVAIVGESGCGKSTLAKVLLGLEIATNGKASFAAKPIQDTPIERRDVETIASVQMIFQNPFDTLNPSYSVGSQIIRTLERFKVGAGQDERRRTMLNLLDMVKLPRAFAQRMPRQLSGGQKQRIGVARAFAGKPRLIIADEPMSALDVSVQAAISELLMNLQRQSKTTMVFISHDLSVVRYLADRVIVMYLGHIVEQGRTEQIFSPPFHPYTEALLSAIPLADAKVKKRIVVLEGEIPSALSPPPGCPFQTRCGWKARVPGDLCERVVPPMVTVAGGHEIKCHLPAETLAAMEPVFS